MERTAVTPHTTLDRARHLTHRGVDEMFDRVAAVLDLAPALGPQRLAEVAGAVGRTFAERVQQAVADAGEPGPARTAPPGPNVVTPEEPASPAREGAAAARAERRRRSPAAKRAPRAEEPTPEQPDELVYRSGES